MNTDQIRVLLIEDNPGDARLLQEMLRHSAEAEYQVDVCGTLGDGLKFLELQTVNIILLDLSLPDSLGIETVYRLQEAIKTLPIVVLTGNDDKAVGIQALKAGAQDHLLKDNMNTRLIERAIAYAIERHQNESALRKSEENYRSLIEDAFNNASIAVFILDKDFKIVWINYAAEVYFDIKRETAVGQDMRDLTRDHIQHLCEDPESFTTWILNSYEQKDTDTRRDCHILPGSAYAERWLEHSSRPIHSGMYAGGRIVQYTDVTDLKRTQQAERVQRILAEALRDTGSALTSTLDLDEVLDRVLENIERVLLHDAANIMLLENDKVYIARQQGYVNGTETEKSTKKNMPLQEAAYLTTMLSTGVSLISHDVRIDPQWASSEESHRWCAYLGTPIYLQDNIIGFINLYSDSLDFYTDIDAEWLEAFAKQAAIGIQNARQHQQIRELSTIQERQRLARELHDSVTQALFTTTVMADSALRQWKVNPNKAHSLMTQVLQLATAALAEMRVLLLELRPQALVQVSFEHLIQQLLASLKGRKQITIDTEIDTIPVLPADVKMSLYRIAQEILNNLVKHSGATHTKIQVKNQPDKLTLTIQDNGIGFDLDQVAPSQLGLGMMYERANIIGANLQIESIAGQGTQITVTWPYEMQGELTNGSG